MYSKVVIMCENHENPGMSSMQIFWKFYSNVLYIPELQCYFLARLSFPRGLVPQRPKKSGSLECLPSLHFRRSSTPSPPPRRDGSGTGMGKGSFLFVRTLERTANYFLESMTALCCPYQALGLVSIS
jgi:hypothetical protein